MVPTVDRGLRLVDFWSIDTAGERPSMKSTSGLSIWPRNWRAEGDSDSTYRRWPSAKIVSNARLDLPDPESPVNTIIASRGRSRLTSRRLCSRAPRTIRRSATCAPSSSVSTQHSPAATGAAHRVPGQADEQRKDQVDRYTAEPAEGPQKCRGNCSPALRHSRDRRPDVPASTVAGQRIAAGAHPA